MSFTRIKELLEDKQFNEAQELATECLADKEQAEVNGEELHLLRAQAYLGLNKADEAINETNIVLENNLDPDSLGVAEACRLRAQAVRTQGDEEQADGLDEAATNVKMRANKRKREYIGFTNTDFSTPEFRSSQTVTPDDHEHIAKKPRI